MAFPTFEDITTTAPTASTVINMSYPTTVANDDLLIMIVGVRADTITTSLTGWTHMGSSGGSQTDMAVWWRKGVSGDSGGSITVNFDGTPNRNASGAIYRFSGTADPDTTPPEVTLSKLDSDSTDKDPPTETPSWGADDTTWIAAFFHRTDGSVSTWPTSNNGAGSAYTNTTTALNGTDAHLSGYAHIERNAASENPSKFVTSKTADYSVCTIAVPPSGAGGGGITGTGDGDLAAVTGSASGTIEITGTGAGTLSAVTGSATGNLEYTGTASGTLGAVTGSASGTYTPAGNTGTGAGTLDAVTGSASGILIYSGTGAGTLDSVTGSASGTFSGSFTGTGAGTLDAVTGSASGAFSSADFNGSGAGTLDAITGSATGNLEYNGTGAGTLAAITGSSVGIIEITGTGVGTLAAVTGDASGTISVAVTGTGAGELEAVIGSAVGTITGAGWTIESDDSSSWTLQTDDSTTWTLQ
jgi:hypothetical protein